MRWAVRGLGKRQPLGCGKFTEPLEGRFADSPCRLVDRAEKCDVVPRIVQQAEVGQDIANLFASKNSTPWINW